MILIRSALQFQKTLASDRLRNKKIGFIPTMGALHEGHLSLVRESKKKNDITAVSIFVNPTQFGPNEDFKKYPRVLAKDARLLKREGVEYLFYPTAEEIYPSDVACSIQIDSKRNPWLATSLCGKFRPGHFEGVATVVAKLFNLSGKCAAYFGEKDWQQTRVIQRLIEDFKFPIQLCVLPTLRESSGLAMSSRNRYLSKSEKEKAVFFAQVLQRMRVSALAGNSLKRLERVAIRDLRQQGIKPQFVQFVDGDTLQPLQVKRKQMRVIAACFVGKTRLIDNLMI